MIKAFYPARTEDIWHIGKNGKVYRLDAIDQNIRLKQKLINDSDFNLEIVNNPMDTGAFLLSHSEQLLKAYMTGEPKDLVESSGMMWQPTLYPFVINSSWTAVNAASCANKTGGSVALVGGGDHAEYERPFGFSTVNTIAISVNHLLKEHDTKVAVLDLDVHYGNAFYQAFKGKHNVVVCGIWNKNLDKWTYTPAEDNLHHEKVDSADIYIKKLREYLAIIKEFNANILIYHLGLDVLESDRMGGINDFSEEVLFERDRLVQKFVKDNNVKVCIFMAGAYVNYSNSPEQIENQKKYLTDLQIKILKGYI